MYEIYTTRGVEERSSLNTGWCDSGGVSITRAGIGLRFARLLRSVSVVGSVTSEIVSSPFTLHVAEPVSSEAPPHHRYERYASIMFSIT